MVKQGSSNRTLKSSPPRGNLWRRRRHGADWPLAFDLGRGIGRPAWWAAAGKLVAGLVAAIALSLLPAAFSDAPDNGAGAAETVLTAAPPQPARQALALAGSAQAAALQLPATPLVLLPEPSPRMAQVTLSRGDTLMDAVVRAGADRLDAHNAIAALSDFFDPRRLRIGQAIDVLFKPEAGLQGGGKEALDRLALRMRFDERLVAARDGRGGYAAAREPLEVTRLERFAAGVIDDSLYLAASRAGVPPQIIVELIRVYSFDVDFQREIRAGDRFEILYERAVAQEDGRYEDGNILYAKLTLRGRERPLYRHVTVDKGEVDYFDGEGRSVRKALMKTPIDGARLTSRFGPRRHPVLGYTRMHQGADFGAPTGTPIYAAGNGVVERASRYGSYGNYIRIRHNSTYTTVYAHLSRYGRGIRAGRRVEQGEVIGYVGATGRVTGAHLHYEVFVNGRRVDPLKLKLPSGRTLKGEALAAFAAERTARDGDLDLLRHVRRLAAAAPDPALAR